MASHFHLKNVRKQLKPYQTIPPPMELILAALEESYVAYHSSSTPLTPFITLAYAQSLDGCVAAQVGAPLLLSSKKSMVMTHHLRAWHDAILVGVGTVAADNPSLTVRLCPGEHPIPVILDPSLRTPPSCQLLTSDQCHPRPIIAYIDHKDNEQRKTELTKAGATLLLCQRDPHHHNWLDLQDVMVQLHQQHQILKIMVEGGAGIITSLLKTHVALQNQGTGCKGAEHKETTVAQDSQGLIDMVNITMAPIFVGGVRSIQSLLPHSSRTHQYPKMQPMEVYHLDQDIVLQGPMQ